MLLKHFKTGVSCSSGFIHLFTRFNTPSIVAHKLPQGSLQTIKRSKIQYSKIHMKIKKHETQLIFP